MATPKRGQRWIPRSAVDVHDAVMLLSKFCDSSAQFQQQRGMQASQASLSLLPKKQMILVVALNHRFFNPLSLSLA